MRTILCFLCLTLAGFVFGADPAVNLDSKAKRALVEAALQLKNGDSVDVVFSKLGKPTYDDVMQRKEESKPFGRRLAYYAVIWKAGLVNELNDELVSVYLDDHGSVQSVSIRISLKE
jgi:hypothetical protein